ncbi:hypothetical protein ABG768_022935 [Culter alburnus]|uniref:WW-binding domain-containing protein n=1 Tax=Culter alburnus TaxID=194366 RepID=A0AAW2AN53_CULAL
MTKRRAENILPSEIPIKRSFRSLYNIDKPVVGVNVVQSAKPSSLLSFVGQHCRKRPKYFEDPLDTDNLPRKVAANRVDSVLVDKNTCKSRTFEDAGRPVTRRSSCARQMESNKQPEEENNLTAGDKVMHTDEDLSPFNSFQFWRVPLPELDISLLESEPSTGSYTASFAKDLEAMET